MQCAERIAAGMSNPQIAEELRLNPGTVKVYVSSLYDAVGVKTRLELLIWFRDRFGRSMDRRGELLVAGAGNTVRTSCYE
jgi:DNA-binding NarL/FixJ family response regulator